MTHGPPKGILDRNAGAIECGDEILAKEVRERVKPKFHLFGHIHEAYGVEKVEETTYINASTCDYFYKPKHYIPVFDIKL